MRVTPAASSSFQTFRSTRSTPSCKVLASMSAGSICANRDKSSSASARRATRSACARIHISLRSFVMRLRKLSNSAASRRCRSFQTSASDGAVGAVSAPAPLCDASAVGRDEEVGAETSSSGSPVSGSREGARGVVDCGGCDGDACRLLVIDWNFQSDNKIGSKMQEGTPGTIATRIAPGQTFDSVIEHQADGQRNQGCGAAAGLDAEISRLCERIEAGEIERHATTDGDADLGLRAKGTAAIEVIDTQPGQRIGTRLRRRSTEMIKGAGGAANDRGVAAHAAIMCGGRVNAIRAQVQWT